MDSIAVAPVQALDKNIKETLKKIAMGVRGVSIDAVQKANSGHPGLPMGCADIGAYLYAIALQHNPKNSKWLARDRFILSAGHGSMFLYSLLHFAGFDVSMDDIKHFRQLHSRTPGHPESLDTDGVETTTGPLGQGIGNAVGQALGLKLLGKRFNTKDHTLFNSKVFTLVGDGDIMEGVSSEVSSFAGHLKINNLIVLYDANKICLDGPLDECCSEDTAERYRGYGFDVFEVDGYDLDGLHQIISSLRVRQEKPAFILCHTIIGKGSPNKAGTHNAHGSPLGPEEVEASKDELGIPKAPPFYVAQEVYDYFGKRLEAQAKLEEKWNQTVREWGKANPALLAEFEQMSNRELPEGLEEALWNISIKTPIAGREASNDVIQTLAKLLPDLYGGSADLSGSDKTMIKGSPIVSPGNFTGRNIKFGVREFGMATIATGMAQTTLIRPFIGTFLTFSDYMRNAIRLAALMKEHVIYHFTHDSIFLGEDGPTHQPVEQYASLRAIPNLHFIRPADANEVKMAWFAALTYDGPTAFSLSRQNLPELKETRVPYSKGMGRGAYLLKKEKKKADYTLIATGSEVSLALEVSQELEKMGKDVRVISMPCWELFEQQPPSYKDEIFGGDIGLRVSLEAGVEQGWHKYIGREGIAICMDSFGLSAPQKQLAEEFGFTVEGVLNRIL